MENHFAPCSLEMTSSNVGVIKCGRNTALFRSLGSRHNLTDPFVLVTQTNELTHDVGLVTGVIMSCSTRDCSSALYFYLRATGIR